eukprot:jgi/Undpi1/5247/HiC_scaffold_2.g00528.m1
MLDSAVAVIWAWAISAGSALKDPDELRNVGFLILSAEALIVTCCWPRLFPSRTAASSPRRRLLHRQGNHGKSYRVDDGDKSTCSGGGGVDGSARSCRNDSGARSRRSDSGALSRLSDGQARSRKSDSGAASHRSLSGAMSRTSDGGPTSRRSDSGARSKRSDSGRERSQGGRGGGVHRWGEGRRALVRVPRPRPPATDRKGLWLLRQFTRGFLLMSLTLSTSYLATCFAVNTYRARVSYEKDFINGVGREGGLEGGDVLSRVDAIGRVSDGAEDDREKKATRLKRGADERRKAQEQERANKKIKKEEAEELKLRQRRQQQEEEQEKRRLQQRQKEEQEEKRRREQQKKREELEQRRRQEQQRKEQEQLRKKEEQEQQKREQEREREQLQKKQKEERDLKERKAREEKKRKEEREQKAREEKQAREKEKKAPAAAVKKTSTLEEGEGLRLGRALSNGTTELRVMENGDLVLSEAGKRVWMARGSKKRRGLLVSWIWRTIRRQPKARPCLECELREKRKLLWSGGQPKKRPKKKKRKKGKVPTVQLTDDDYSATAEGSGGAVGTYRLVVTDDGNAVLKRGDVEVVWKALPK